MNRIKPCFSPNCALCCSRPPGATEASLRSTRVSVLRGDQGDRGDEQGDAGDDCTAPPSSTSPRRALPSSVFIDPSTCSTQEPRRRGETQTAKIEQSSLPREEILDRHFFTEITHPSPLHREQRTCTYSRSSDPGHATWTANAFATLNPAIPV